MAKKKHVHTPGCVGCEQGMDKLLERDAKAFKKYGWVAHFVFDPEYPLGMNYHTHGVPESFNHPDFQVCLPLQNEVVHSIVSTLVDRVKAGESFKAGQKVSEVIGNDMLVTFKEAEECGRPVLRVIFPDKSGSLEPNGVDEKFAEQWRDND